ncbi:MAG: hypothetical protein HC904_00900 [Blastochloris sp.]|nr:hypothetical protein [Blastochloris sp.]
MKEFRTREGPYPLRLQYEVSEIDDICCDALRQVKLLPENPEPIKVDLFLEKYFQVVVDYPDLGDGIMGSAIFNSKGAVTGFLISSRIEHEGTATAERRVRSTLAHEGGHGLLHPKLFIEDSTPSLFGPQDPSHKGSPKFLCRTSDISPVSGTPVYNGKWWEWQANRAISGLLLPKSLFRKAISSFLEESQYGPKLPGSKRQKAEQHLAETFDVNPVVARIRLTEIFPPTKQVDL